MVRRKHILGAIVQSFILIGLIGVEGALVGYSMAFGPDHGGIIGDLSWFGWFGFNAGRGAGSPAPFLRPPWRNPFARPGILP